MRSLLVLLLAIPLAAQEWGPYRGANVNHQFSEEDARVFTAWGGNLIRINFHQLPLMDKQPPYAINMAAVESLDRILGICERYGIRAVIDPHTTPGTAINFTTSPTDALWRDFAFHDHLIRLWDFLARRYHDRGPVIAGYDLLNEPAPPTGPGTVGTAADWNLLARRIAAAIRAVDKEHTLIVEFPIIANVPGGLPPVQAMVDYLDVLDDANTVYSVHWYGPGEFTHQGVDGRPTGLRYPGVYRGVLWNAALHRALLQPVADFQKRHGIAIYLGEFAAARWAGADGNRWMEDVAEVAEREGWSWTYHAFRIGTIWDAEKSNTDPADETRYESTARVEWLKSIFARNRGPAPRQTRSVPVDGAVVFEIDGSSAQPAAGWMALQTASGSGGLQAHALIRLRQNGVTVFEASVPGMTPTPRLRIPIEDRRDAPEPLNTVLAVINPGDRPARVRASWRSPTGTILSTREWTIEPGFHRSGFWHEFAEVAQDEGRPVSGSLDFESDAPIAATALRLTLNRRGDLLFTPAPVIDLLRPASVEAVRFPHLVEGTGFSSWWTLANPTGHPQSGNLRLLRGDRQPLQIQSLQGESASGFRYEIPPHGIISFSLDGSSPDLLTGWAVAQPDPGHTAPFGISGFRFTKDAATITEATFPAAETSALARYYLDLSGVADAGLAFANPSDTAALIELQAFTGTGTRASDSVTISLGPLEQRASPVRDILPDLPSEYRGVIEVRSSLPVVMLGVRALTNERDEVLFSVLPGANLSRPAPSPVVIPHVATGGGFESHLLVFGGPESGSVAVTLFSPEGRLLPLLQR